MMEEYIQTAIRGVKSKGRIMESGQITVDGEEWKYKIQKLKK